MPFPSRSVLECACAYLTLERLFTTMYTHMFQQSCLETKRFPTLTTVKGSLSRMNSLVAGQSILACVAFATQPTLKATRRSFWRRRTDYKAQTFHPIFHSREFEAWAATAKLLPDALDTIVGVLQFESTNFFGKEGFVIHDIVFGRCGLLSTSLLFGFWLVFLRESTLFPGWFWRGICCC